MCTLWPGNCSRATHFFFVPADARDGHPETLKRVINRHPRKDSNALRLNRHIGYMDSEIWLFMTRELQACHRGKRCQRTIRKLRAATARSADGTPSVSVDRPARGTHVCPACRTSPRDPWFPAPIYHSRSAPAASTFRRRRSWRAGVDGPTDSGWRRTDRAFRAVRVADHVPGADRGSFRDSAGPRWPLRRSGPGPWGRFDCKRAAGVRYLSVRGMSRNNRARGRGAAGLRPPAGASPVRRSAWHGHARGTAW